MCDMEYFGQSTFRDQTNTNGDCPEINSGEDLLGKPFVAWKSSHWLSSNKKKCSVTFPTTSTQSTSGLVCCVISNNNVVLSYPTQVKPTVTLRLFINVSWTFCNSVWKIQRVCMKSKNKLMMMMKTKPSICTFFTFFWKLGICHSYLNTLSPNVV